MFLPPQPELFLLGTFYSKLLHRWVVADLRIRKLAVLAEDYVEAQADDADSHQQQSGDEDFHIRILVRDKGLEDEAVAYRLVVVYLVDYVCKSVGYREYRDLALVLCRIV